MVVFTVSLDCLWEMKSCAKGQVNLKLKFTVMSPCCIHNPAYCLLHHYKVFSRTEQPTAVLCIPPHAIGCPTSAPEAKYHPLSFKNHAQGHHSCLCGGQTLGYCMPQNNLLLIPRLVLPQAL